MNQDLYYRSEGSAMCGITGIYRRKGVHPWMDDFLDTEVRPVLLSRRCRERGIFDVKRLERLLSRKTLKDPTMAYAMFRWFSAEHWFRVFIDGDGI